MKNSDPRPSVMKSHYLKLSPALKPYAFKIDPTPMDWEQDIFQDITENGTVLIVERLPPSERGQRVGLCGDKYYCEAGPNSERNDSLFVFKIESANRRRPRSVPHRYPAKISRLEIRSAPGRDSISHLWDDTTAGTVSELSAVSASMDQSPSIQLLRLAVFASPEIRSLYWPQRSLYQVADSDWFDSLKRTWAKFQLGKAVIVSGRQESLLKGIVPFQQISSAERERLLALFDIGFFNAYAKLTANRIPFFIEFLRSMAGLPLSPSTRSKVWSAMATDLYQNELLRELKSIVQIFEDPEIPQEIRRVWEDTLIDLLERRLRSSEDPAMRELLDRCREDDQPLVSMSRWLLESLTFALSSPSDAERVAATPIEKPQVVVGEVPSSRVEAQPPEEDSSLPLVRPMIKEWALSLQGTDSVELDVVIREISDKTKGIGALTERSDNPDQLLALIELIEGLHTASSSWLESLPDYDRYLADIQEATDAYDRAHGIVGEKIDDILTSMSVTPSDLIAAANLLVGSSAMQALPRWVWPEAAKIEEPLSVEQLYCQLLSPQVRETVVSILGSVGELGSYDTKIISLIPPPPYRPDSDGILPDVDEHVRAWLSSMFAMLRELPAEIASHFPHNISGDSAESVLRQALSLYRKLDSRVSVETREAIVRSVIQAANEPAAIVTSELYEGAISFCEQHFGSAADASYAQLRARVEKASHASTSQQEHRLPIADVRLEHNWVDGRGGKVTLLFSPAPDQKLRPYGYISVPLVIVGKQRKTSSFKLQYEVKTGHRDVWPREWEMPEPTEILIPEEAWRDDPDELGQYLHTFKARVPIRRSARGERFEFEVALTNIDAGRTYAPFRFSWDVLNEISPVASNPTWSETVDFANVEKHPVGPQKKYRDLLSRLQNGGSFSVTAPRRFGKSTLVQYLQNKAREEGFIVPDPVICTSYYLGVQGLDYDRLWQDVSDRLQHELGASVTRREGALIPNEEAFDHVRRAAATSGKKGIALFFDEAQLFFSTRSAVAMGDLLKDRLERHWSRSSPGMSKLVFGFVGLPSLHTRAGVNLNGLLRPIAHNELEENELNSLILAVTNGSVQTTREARRRLARTAGNIYILRTLVDELVSQIQSDGRSWANFDDVIAVEGAMRATLRDGRERIVSSYIRDILNDAEDVNLWQPNPAVPLAIAIAETRQRRIASNKLFDEAKARITSWFDGLPSSTMTSLAYDEPQFAEHLRTLEERSVLRGREFTSCLVEDWLLGLHKTMDETSWRDLLISSALKRIRIPSVLKKIEAAEGGEASVKIGITEGQPSAYRVTRLRTPEDRMRFAETREVLEKLKQNMDGGSLGARYVFRIGEVGLSADDDNDAVQVYRWIEGSDLSRRLAELRGPYVAELGAKLAQGLQFIHSLNILHRDLSPRNIVVSDEGGDPVIIDFGFARRISDDIRTEFNSDFAAPEVRRPGAKWTRAADVYSLGSTLAKILDPKDMSGSLLKIIQECGIENPEKRPDAAKLIGMFEEAKQELHVESKKSAAWKAAQSACPSYGTVTWFKAVVDKLEGNFVSVALGCLPRQFDRSREVANFLNQLLEAYSAFRRMPDKLSLGKVKDDNPQTGKTANSEAVKFMHSLRNYHSHGSIRSTPRLTDEQMLQYCIDAASQIGQIVKLNGLEEITKQLASGRI
jgi:serine/threonine protein kinase